MRSTTRVKKQVFRMCLITICVQQPEFTVLLLILFMFQLLVVKRRYASASHQVPENQIDTVKIAYILL